MSTSRNATPSLRLAAGLALRASLVQGHATALRGHRLLAADSSARR